MTGSTGETEATGSTGAHIVTLRHALVPIDGSLLAESALDTIGARLAGRVVNEFTLLYAVDPRDGNARTRAALDLLAGTQQRFRQRLQAQGSETLDVVITLSAPVGAPAASILVEAAAQQCDVILMSTRGEAGIGRLRVGSVADRIIRDGALPTLFVHPPKA
jgi:nucleotide-binding universal stress UspA family protein